MRRVGEVRWAWMKEGRGEKGEQAATDAFYGGSVARQRGKAGGPRVGAAWREGSGEERGPWVRWGTARTSDIGPGRRARTATLLRDRGGQWGAGDTGVSG
jgi:hypothetical protein